MFADRPLGYVDLRSPAGIGLGALVYNYDGNPSTNLRSRNRHLIVFSEGRKSLVHDCQNDVMIWFDLAKNRRR
jgi:hypothetical protein